MVTYDIESLEMGVSENLLVLPIAEIAGSIWLLENVHQSGQALATRLLRSAPPFQDLLRRMNFPL